MINLGVINEIFNFYICQCHKSHYILFLLLYDYKRKLVALLYFVFLVFHDCCVALPCSAMGLSAVCDCGI